MRHFAYIALFCALFAGAVSASSFNDEEGPRVLAEWLCGDAAQCISVDDLLAGHIQPHDLFAKIVHRVRSSITDVFAPSKAPGDALPSFVSAIPDRFTHFIALARKYVAARQVETPEDIASVLLEILNHNFGYDTTKNKYPYFGFLPDHKGNLLPGGPAVSWSTKCFSNMTGKLEWADSAKSKVTMTLTVAGQRELLCLEVLYIGAINGRALELLDAETTKTATWNASGLDAVQQWDLDTMGARVYYFPMTVTDLIGDVLSTVTMMTGFAQKPLKKATLDANIDFLNNYVEFAPRMQPKTVPRSGGDSVGKAFNTSDIADGDSLIVLRPDGLDPMISWAEGWESGHSVMAIRMPDANGKLHVCESTALDAYWPHNGIQCHEYHEWIKLANEAQFMVLLAPLSAATRASFDADKARAFFSIYKGQNYGYANMLFGWIDTHTQNMPCLPPKFERCLSRTLAQTIFMLGDYLMGPANNNLFRQAINHRTNTTGLPVIAALMKAQQSDGLTFMDVAVIPEQDSWKYNMTWNNGTWGWGKAMVCNVFVCHMWKHGGVFDGIDKDINCGEQTLWDVYSMDIYDKNRIGVNRPSLCKTADANATLCQLVGDYTLHPRPDFNTRALYKKMGQKCPSHAPDFVRPAGC